MATPNSSLTNLWVDDGPQTGGPQQRVIQVSTNSAAPITSHSAPQTHTIKLEEFLRMCKEAGVEKPEGLVHQPALINQTQGLLTRVTQRSTAQPSPLIQKIITTQASQPLTRTIQMDDILKAVKMQQQQQTIQSTVVTQQIGGQKVISIQVPASMAQSGVSASPAKPSPFKMEAQHSAAYNATKLHSYTATESPVLMTSANNSPSTAQRVLSMNSPQQSWQLHANKRDVDLMDTSEFLESKRFRKSEKGGKGLRHFSMKVCEKVQKKGVTSYNEVADELVAEFSDPRNMSPSDQNYDQKNIRRRVYDALNVLMAMNIISKEKKEIRWIGLPTNSQQECQTLEIEKQRRIQRIQEKKQQLQELLLQQVAFKNIVQRNKNLQRAQGPPPANSAIHLPYIIVNTSKKTVIDCSISNDKYEYLFNFDNTFEIHDDIEVLKRMGMAYGLEKGQCSKDDMEKAIKLVPKVFEPYIVDLATGGTSSTSSLLSQSRVKGRNGTARFNNNNEVAAENEAPHRVPSRQSSVGSYSDLTPSHATTDISDLLSDDDDDMSDD